MNKLTFSLIFAAVAAGMGFGSGAALADANEEGAVALVCYKWTAFPDERLRLSVRKPAPITTATADPLEPIQQTWGATGKHIGSCGPGTANSVVGVVNAAPGQGARFGLQSLLVRGNGETDHCRGVTWSCSADEAVRTPLVWHCESRNEFNTYHGASDLLKVTDPGSDPLCGIYESEFADVPTAGPVLASGRK